MLIALRYTLLWPPSLHSQWLSWNTLQHNNWRDSDLQLCQWIRSIWISHHNLSGQWELGGPSCVYTDRQVMWQVAVMLMYVTINLLTHSLCNVRSKSFWCATA